MITRIFIISLSLLTCSYCAEAQDMSVAQFKLLENDLTANTHGTERKDQFGNTAAIIKISAPMVDGYTFDGGQQGIVATEQKGGELWLYVPAGSQRLTISHRLFGKLENYHYPISIQSARTYEMLLDIGTGRFVTITSSQAKADIEVDGQFIGRSPVMHYYLPFGNHTLKAISDNQEGLLQVFHSSNDSIDAPLYRIEMQSTTPRTGTVFLTVDDNAAIYFRGEHVGNGRWRTQLREGEYEVETRNADCEPARTSFKVVANQENHVPAQVPKQLMGKLNIISKVRRLKVRLDGEPFMTGTPVEIPCGTYQLEMKNIIYRTIRKEYRVDQDKLLVDTLKVRPRVSFHIGIGYGPIGNLSTFRAIYGLQIGHHEFGLTHTFEDSKSIPFSYREINHQAFTGFYGYRFVVNNMFTITPKFGITAASINVTDTYDIEDTQAILGYLGCTFLLTSRHLGLYVTPEVNIPFSKGAGYEEYTSKNRGDINISGLGISAGVLLSL